MKLWIARDKDGDLYLYVEKPERYFEKFICDTFADECMRIDKNLFPEVTWENSPRKVKIELV